jgi:hypothetical protein
MLQSLVVDLDIIWTVLYIRRYFRFMFEKTQYHNRIFHLGFIVLVMTVILVSLSYHPEDTQFITTAKAISERLPAGDLSVVGGPSLPAATVDMIFRNLGSPMVGTGRVVEQMSKQANIDDAFALAVWWVETNDGAAGVGLADHNPGSVRGSIGYPSAFDGYTIYPSYSAAVIYWFNMLKNRYVDQGLNTVYLISHPYVGTTSSPLWAAKVVALILKYRGEAPLHPSTSSNVKRGASASVYIDHISLALLHLQQARSQMINMRRDQTPLIVRQVQTTPMSPATTRVLVFLALLLALAIVICVFWVEKRSKFSVAQFQVNDTKIPLESSQYMPPQGMNVQSTPSPLHGRLLLPSIPVSDTTKKGELAVTSSPRERPLGLLSRYGETRQQ